MFGNLKNRLMKEMEGLEGKLANIGGKQSKNGAEKTKSEEDISSVAKTGAETSSMKEEEKLNSEEVEDQPEVENSEESSEIEDIKINHSIKQAVKTGPDGEISVYPLGVKSIETDHPLSPSSGEVENVS